MAPKSVFLHVQYNMITANVVEFYSDELGKLDYLTNTSILFVNKFAYSCKALLVNSRNKARLEL